LRTDFGGATDMKRAAAALLALEQKRKLRPVNDFHWQGRRNPTPCPRRDR
jgi:hypothetical protein